MPKYVVTYVWEETCYVEADTPDEARDVADGIEMVPDDLDLRHDKTRVRKATRGERAGCTFEKAEEEDQGD